MITIRIGGTITAQGRLVSFDGATATIDIGGPALLRGRPVSDMTRHPAPRGAASPTLETA